MGKGPNGTMCDSQTPGAGCVSISILDLSVSLRSHKREKCLVQPLSVFVPGGSLFGIVGGSGSGKTSLLNVLADRYDKQAFEVKGSVEFGAGRGPSVGVGYVTQSDHTLPFLTVRETLTFASYLKIDDRDEDRASVVEAILLDLGLKEAAETRVGDASVGGIRGISGGERRRLSVGLQILSSPEVLYCDECTSGLDAFTANNVMETIRRLTITRKTTVVCSIHQPRSDIFNLFDNVLVLSRGGFPVYCGPTADVVSYFSKLGHACPLDQNPADYIVDISSVDPRDGAARAASTRRVRRLEREFRRACDSRADLEAGAAAAGVISAAPLPSAQPELPGKPEQPQRRVQMETYKAPWLLQVTTLVGRFMRNSYRDTSAAAGGLLQAAVLGIVIMAIFWQLGNDPASVRSRFGVVYISITAEPYIFMIICVERLCREMRVFDRELQDGLYSPSAYLLASVVALTPQLLVQPLFFALPIYFGSNLRLDGASIITYLALNVLLAYLINGLAWSCVALERNFSVASLIANSQFTFICLTSGFLVNSRDLPVYVEWVKNISFVHYSYRLLLSSEFSHNSYTSCGMYPASAVPVCTTLQGSDLLAAQDVAVDDYGVPWGALFGMAVGYHLVALLLLNVIRVPPTGSVGGEGGGDEAEELEGAGDLEGEEEGEIVEKQKQKDEEVGEASTELTFLKQPGDTPAPPHDRAPGASEPSGPVPVTVTVHNLSVSVVAAGAPKAILHQVHASFCPGRLCFVMGGSGSGKTTLLDLIARRVKFATSAAASASASAPATSSSAAVSPLAALGLARSTYQGSGSILYNHASPTDAQLRQSLGYVRQHDYHLPSLTVRETLLFNAHLQMDPGTLAARREERVDAVLQVLGLQACRHTRVGGEEVKGVSGGEKRRLSVGIQLLLDPSIVLFDEVTTGLCSFSSLSVVETLGRLCRSGTAGGRTVVMSIHSPRSDIFSLCDDVVLLSRGRVVWSGDSAGMLRHLAALGHPCPPLTNPADWVLDVSSVDVRSPALEAESRARVATLVEAFAERRGRGEGQGKGPVGADGGGAGAGCVALCLAGDGPSDEQSQGQPPLSSSTPHDAPASSSIALLPLKPLSFTLPLLLRRSLLNQKRNPVLMSTRISQGLFFALILSCFFAPLGSGQSSIQSRIGLMYMNTSLTFIGMLNCVAVFPLERNVFLREYVDGSYSTTAFFLSYFVLAVPFIAASAAMLSVLLTWATGISRTAEGFGLFFFVQFCFMFCGECVGVAFLSIFHNVGFSINIVSVVISIFSMASGFISIQQAAVVDALNHLSPVKWGAWVLTNVAFRKQTFDCTALERATQGGCLPTGEDVLRLYKMYDTSPADGGDLGDHLLILGMLSMGFCAVSWVFLRVRALLTSH